MRAAALSNVWQRRLLWPLAVAVVLRLVALLYHPMIDTDSAYYGAVAHWFASGHWEKAFDPVWPPFYPFLMSLLLRIHVPAEAAGIAVSFAASTACVLTFAALGNAVGGPRVQRGAAWLAAVHPKLVAFSQQVLTEALYVFLVSWALALLARATLRPGSRRGLMLAGVCLGLAFLARPEAIALLLAAVLFLGWDALNPSGPVPVPVSRRARAGNAAAAVAACAACFLAVALPYLAHIAALEGRWTLGEKGALNFYLTYRDTYAADGLAVRASDFAAITAPQVPRVAGDYRIGTFLHQRAGLVLRHAAANVPRALFDKVPGLAGWPVFLIALVGLGWRRAIPRRRFEVMLVLVILAVVGSFAPLFLYRRFFVATLPAFVLWAAIGGEELAARFNRRRVRSLAVALLAALAISGQVSLARQRPPVLYRAAGKWLGGQAGTRRPLVVAARKPETAFYANAEFRPLAARDLNDLEMFLAQSGTTHLVVDDYILPQSHPGLALLLDPKMAPPWLRLVHTSTGADHRVLIYESPAGER